MATEKIQGMPSTTAVHTELADRSIECIGACTRVGRYREKTSYYPAIIRIVFRLPVQVPLFWQGLVQMAK